MDLMEEAREHYLAGRYAEALRTLQTVMDHYPGQWETHLRAGEVYMKLEKHREAVGEFQEVMRLSPENAALAYEYLGDVVVALGKPPHAVVVWYMNAANLFEQDGELQEARRCYHKVLEVDANNQEARRKVF